MTSDETVTARNNIVKSKWENKKVMFDYLSSTPNIEEYYFLNILTKNIEQSECKDWGKYYDISLTNMLIYEH